MRLFLFLLLLAAPLLAQEEEGPAFETEPVTCAPIQCEVLVPAGWKVAKDHTGISAQGGGMGFVITREPLLDSEKSFGTTWQRQLADGGVAAKVTEVHAGRLKAFRAQWEPKSAPDRIVEVYRVHVPELELLYNVSFSFPKGGVSEGIVKGVLQSFKCTADAAKLELQEPAVAVGSATMNIPVGYTKVDRGQLFQWRMFSDGYASTMKGYTPPRIAGVIAFEEYEAGRGLAGGSGTTSQTETFVVWLAGTIAQPLGTPTGKPKTKPSRYGAFKGHAMTGTYADPRGGTRELYLFAGKSKQTVVAVLLFVHERELKVHPKFFSSVLRTLKAGK